MRLVRSALALVLIVLAPSFSAAAQPDAKAETASALKQLESWLGSGPVGVQWGKYLDLGVLHRELERSGPVDLPADPGADQTKQRGKGPGTGPVRKAANKSQRLGRRLELARPCGPGRCREGCRDPVSSDRFTGSGASSRRIAAQEQRAERSFRPPGGQWRGLAKVPVACGPAGSIAAGRCAGSRIVNEDRGPLRRRQARSRDLGSARRRHRAGRLPATADGRGYGRSGQAV